MEKVKEVADERFVPRDFSIPFSPFIRHFDRYFQCVKLLGKVGKNETWLDCACGSGYGTNLLTGFAGNVVGYDIDHGAIKFASENYKNDYCKFTTDISMYRDKFDVILSVETIEHMPEEDAPEFLKLLNSTMKENATLIITTPIVKSTNYNPTNEFHYIEYSNNHFVELLSTNGFEVKETNFVETTFTDGETKDQGYYKCQKHI